MALVAQKYQDQLDRLKKNVTDWHKYWRSNISRYTECREFLFKTAIGQNERGIADELQRPQLEVNVLETYVSHLVGEFSKQTPSPSVNPIGNDPQLADQAMVVEEHLRFIFSDSRPDQICAFRNILSGGFSALEVTTEYISNTGNDAFKQKLLIKKVLDDTQVGFDPRAKLSHKGDGQYCYKNIPKTKEELEDEIPGIDLSQVKFESSLMDGFPWYFTQPNGNQTQKIVIVCDYFEKKRSYQWLYKCSDPTHPDNNLVMTKDEYDEMMQKYIEIGPMIAPPVILEKSRRAKDAIVHWQFTGDQVLLYEETDYDLLPIVFIDGDSALLNEGQFTKPYIFHAIDTQKMKNVCAQSIMNDIENMRQTDVFIAKEAIPQEAELRLAWLNPQKASAALAYNYFSETNDGVTLPAPIVIQRQQVSAATIQIFQLLDQQIQRVLGSYDAQQGTQSDMSGVAIENGAMQSNNAALPYIKNYIVGMNRVCEILVDLMPKYYTTLRTIPTIDQEGIKGYRIINDTQKNPVFKMEYDRNALEVEVLMDHNFEVQKSRFIQTVSQLMKISPTLNQFFSTDGVPLILDNIQMKDIAKVKQQYQVWMQKQQQQQQQQQQMQMQMNPSVVQQNIANLKAQTDEKKIQVDLIKTLLDKKTEDRKAETADAASQAQVLETQGKLAIAAMTARSEDNRSQVEAAIAMDKHYNETVQMDRDHILNTLETGAKIHANHIKEQSIRQGQKESIQRENPS